MENQLRYQLQTRKNILDLVKKLSIDQLNEIPKHFNNNLIWNMGHVVVTQYLLTYGLCRKEIPIPTEMVEKYRKGSFPKNKIEEDEVRQIKKWLKETPEQVFKTYFDQEFSTFNPYETSYGIKLISIEDSLTFNNLHESMHLGSMLALRRNI